jgi:hypothetical protein
VEYLPFLIQRPQTGSLSILSPCLGQLTPPSLGHGPAFGVYPCLPPAEHATENTGRFAGPPDSVGGIEHGNMGTTAQQVVKADYHLFAYKVLDLGHGQ